MQPGLPPRGILWGYKRDLPGIAPVNPAFLAYQNRTKQSGEREDASPATTILNDGSTTRVFLNGVIPSPIDFSYTRGQQVSLDTGYPLDGDGYAALLRYQELRESLFGKRSGRSRFLLGVCHDRVA